MLLTTALLTAAALTGEHSEQAALEWFGGAFSEAVETATREDRMILVYCWMDSEYCTQLYQETLLDPHSAEPLNEFVLVSAGHADPVGYELMQSLNVQTLPTMFFLDSSGNVEDVISGLIPPATFLHELDRIKSGELTLSNLRSLVSESEKGSEENLESRMRIATKFADLGRFEEHEEMLQSIRKLDPRGKTVPGANLLFQDTMMQVAEDGGGDEHFAEWNLKPLYKVAAKIKPAAAKFEGYNRIADLELGQENPEAACKAYMAAFENASDESVLYWGHDVAGWLIESERELSKKERQFALEVALRVHEAAERKVVKSRTEGEMDGGECPGEKDLAAYVARHLDLVTRAYDLVGDRTMAVTTALKCVELAPTDENRARLEELRSRT